MLDRTATYSQINTSKKIIPIWADIAVLGVAIVWGASYPVAKGALALSPVLTLIFIRFLITAIVMSWIARHDILFMAKRDISLTMLLGSILFLIFIAETYGVSLTSATNTALIISLCVIFTPLLDYGLRKTFPPIALLACTTISCIGVGVLTGGISSLNTGDFFVLGAAILRAIMVVSSKRLMISRQISPAALTAMQAITVAGLTFVIVLTTSGIESLLVTADLNFWLAVGFLSFFCTIAAFYIQNAAVKRTTPTRVSLLMGTEPLFGFALAHILLSEPVTLINSLGALLIVAGTIAAVLIEQRTES